MVQKLLIGASGLLGTHLLLEGDILCPSSKELDIRSVESIRSYLEDKDISEVILLAAFTNVSKANIEKTEAYQVNVLGVRNILNYTRDLKITYISTDYVFNGTKGMYDVNDFVDPVPNNYYALTKALAEESVRSTPNHLIIRTSFCDSSKWPYPAAFNDQYTSRDRVSIIAPMISKAINSDLSGIVHLGTERKTVYDLAKSIDPSVNPISRKQIKDVYIPHDTSLVITKI